MTYVSAKKASELLDYTPDHLRRLANAGKDDPQGFTQTTEKNC